MNKLILSIVFLLCFSLVSYAEEKIEPSFDCKKASTKVEKMICSDAELAQEDKELNELYNKYMEFISKNLPDYKDIIIKAQRNWMRERNNYTSSVLDIKQFYVELRLKLNEAFNPGLSLAQASEYDDKDVEYYYKYLPISYYFKNGYVKDAKNPIYVLYNDDKICQNISSVKLLDFKDFKKRAEVLEDFYAEQDNGTLEATTSMAYRAAVNTYVTKYDNGYFAINNGDFSVSFKYMKRNDKGYYIPYFKRTYYDHDYKKLPKSLIWNNIVRMQQDEPLNDMGYRQRIYTLSLPVVHNNNVYIKELTVYDDIEYSGIDYDKNPPVYDKAEAVKVVSPLVSIFSYDNDGSLKLACVYTENKDDLNKKYSSYLNTFSEFEAGGHISHYMDKTPANFLDYF